MTINAIGLWMVIALLSLTVLYQPRLVAVDMVYVIQRPSEMLSRSTMGKKAQQNLMQRYAALLPKVIADYGKRHRVTIVSGKILVSQSNNDISNIIIEQTLSRLKHDRV